MKFSGYEPSTHIPSANFDVPTWAPLFFVCLFLILVMVDGQVILAAAIFKLYFYYFCLVVKHSYWKRPAVSEIKK